LEGVVRTAWWMLGVQRDWLPPCRKHSSRADYAGVVDLDAGIADPPMVIGRARPAE